MRERTSKKGGGLNTKCHLLKKAGKNTWKLRGNKMNYSYLARLLLLLGIMSLFFLVDCYV